VSSCTTDSPLRRAHLFGVRLGYMFKEVRTEGYQLLKSEVTYLSGIIAYEAGGAQ
jgi:hypothetical protein